MSVHGDVIAAMKTALTGAGYTAYARKRFTPPTDRIAPPYVILWPGKESVQSLDNDADGQRTQMRLPVYVAFVQASNHVEPDDDGLEAVLQFREDARKLFHGPTLSGTRAWDSEVDFDPVFDGASYGGNYDVSAVRIDWICDCPRN